MENNTNNRKRYTFLALNKCVSESGNPYIDITAELYLSGIQFKEVGGKSVCTARAAINNRQKILNNMLGTSYPESEESVWVDVTFWEARADRFKKFIGNETKARLVVVGSVATRSFTRNDGSPGESVTISVNDWLSLATRTPAASTAPATRTAAPTNNSGDDDLPF
jgi:single-stranded DNA-binding protein